MPSAAVAAARGLLRPFHRILGQLALDARESPTLQFLLFLLLALQGAVSAAQTTPPQLLGPEEADAIERALVIEDRDWSRPVEAAEKLRALLDGLPERSSVRRELLAMVGRLYVHADMDSAAEAVAEELELRQRQWSDGSDLAARTIRLRQQSNRDGLASVLEPLRELAPRVDAEFNVRERLRFWYHLGGALSSVAEFGEAAQAYQTAADLAEELGRPGWRSIVLSSQSNVLSQLGQHERAIAMARESLAFAYELGDDILLSDAYTNLGVALESGGDAEGLRTSMQSAILHARRAGNGVSLSLLLGNVAHYHLVRSEYDAAEQISQEALDVADEAEDMRGRSLALANLGLSKIGLGRVEEGKALVLRSLEYDQLEGLRNDMALTHAELGLALERAGDFAGAVQALHTARRLQDEIFREDQQRAVLALQEKVEAKRREKVIEQLEAESARQAAQVQRNRLQQWVWRLLSALLVLALVLVVIGLKRLRASNRHLAGVNAQLRLQSERDPLTGLANRRHVQAVVRHAHGESAFKGTLMLIDLDHFKAVNDRHGHAIGDALLLETARRLRSVCRGNDLAARWGGEEFLLALDWLAPDDAIQLARRLLVELSRPVILDGVRIPVSASIGFAAVPIPAAELSLSFENALRLVDAGLYLAKLRGRNCACGITWIRETAAANLDTVIADIEHAEALGRLGLEVVKPEGDAP